MRKTIQILAYVACIIAGGIMIIITPEGGIHICIACSSMLYTVTGATVMLIGIAGLGTAAWEN